MKQSEINVIENYLRELQEQFLTASEGTIMEKLTAAAYFAAIERAREVAPEIIAILLPNETRSSN